MTREGYIYAAVGERYVTLARRSARSLRKVDPNRPIDLFSSQPVSDPIFDRVHLLERESFRPKIEALRRSRFERSLYMDVDTIALAPVDDVFASLDRYDIAMCPEERRADYRNRLQLSDLAVPQAFPPYNSGVIGLKRSDLTDAFLRSWFDRVHDGTQSFDQKALRGLLYRSPLRLLSLPHEYNMIWFQAVLACPEGYCAPRILHQPILHQMEDQGDPEQPYDLGVILDPGTMDALRHLLSRDQTLSHYVDPGTGREERPKIRRRSLKQKIYDALRRRL